jgi:hypothetical protein
MVEPSASAIFTAIIDSLSKIGRLWKGLAQAVTIPEKIDVVVARLEHSREVRETVSKMEKLVAKHLTAPRQPLAPHEGTSGIRLRLSALMRCGGCV